ncbi:DEAD-box ATP-dependent RNA helicase 27 [Dichanthelium oligosanthes]|uniref:ATP-dependent RNA helicase n=1 Tax=Dichanthelium oligosanthes TaxID=888268 RepID=A0A1E5V223_9POAL|nr:DEAD-box ATP-dependent RNA helicase 27 [Dichanthelium oligosanthes]
MDLRPLSAKPSKKRKRPVASTPESFGDTTYDVAKELMKHHSPTLGYVIGGTTMRLEADQLAKGINDRQTVLFSATQTEKVEDFAKLTFRKSEERQRKLVYVGLDDTMATVEGLEQGYCVIPSEKRFLVLYAFLRGKLKGKKVMVFFSSCNSVKFHAELLNFLGLECYDIHGQRKQQKRIATFQSFKAAKKGILLCTSVAARGLDIPEVHYIVQYDPPDEPKDYIHRVGRTARGDKGEGTSLLFLLPEELKLLIYLQGWLQRKTTVTSKSSSEITWATDYLERHTNDDLATTLLLRDSRIEPEENKILSGMNSGDTFTKKKPQMRYFSSCCVETKHMAWEAPIATEMTRGGPKSSSPSLRKFTLTGSG